MRVVCISDTHNQHEGIPAIPEGDLLIHAGDATGRGRPEAIRAFDAWLGTLPHRHKVVVAGNHDFAFERHEEARSWIRHATYLQDEGVEIEGHLVWGSPWQPRFMDWAFNLDRGAPLREKWDLIPKKVDILVTHGPPMGILDRLWDGKRVGCADLTEAVAKLRPRLHVFGHIHESYGVEEHHGTRFVNACTCTREHRPINPPVVVDL